MHQINPLTFTLLISLNFLVKNISPYNSNNQPIRGFVSLVAIVKFLTLSFIITTFHTTAIAANVFGPYKANIIKVEEADTIFTEVEVWPGLFQRVYIRIKDIDSPEPLKQKGGRPVSACEQRAARKAIKFVKKIIENVSEIEITQVTQIKSTANYVFARISVDGNDLGQALINNKHAISVTGMKRKRWSCRNI